MIVDCRLKPDFLLFNKFHAFFELILLTLFFIIGLPIVGVIRETRSRDIVLMNLQALFFLMFVY